MATSTTQQQTTEIPVKNYFAFVSRMNGNSPYGRGADREAADDRCQEVRCAIKDRNSLAFKIADDSMRTFYTDKQLWVMAFQLKKENYPIYQ